jgi:predicted permease
MRGSTYRSSRLRTALLLLQAALSVVLLVGAGLFVRSLANVRSYRLGYDVDPNVLISGNMRGLELADVEANALADRLLAAAASVPGVSGATLVVSVPFLGNEGRGAPFVPGVDSIRKLGRFMLQAGSPRYFEVAGTRILRGRGFSNNDVATAQPVVVINQAMANAIWPEKDPIGQQMRIGGDTLPFLTVVGIAEDIRGRQFTGDPEFWYYLPMAQYRALFGAGFGPNLFVRVAGDPEDYVPVLRQRLQREMPGAAYINVMPLRALVAPQQRAWRFGATMFVVFATLALVLAAIGLYSVVAYTVAQRTRELGIRIALGASVGAVLRMIVRQGAVFAVAGITAGSAVALLAARWIEPLLFDTPARDPAVFMAVAAILLCVAFAATVRPALRATRVDPTITLRAE